MARRLRWDPLVIRSIELAVCGVLAAAGCVDDVPEAAVSQDIVGGTPLVATDAVVAVEIDGELHCSGVLVSARVVLTAGHCIPPSVDGLSVVAGWNLTEPTLVVAALAATAHPDYDASQSDQDDIGLISLVQDLPVPPLALATASTVAAIDTRSVVTIAGFGRSSDGTAGAKEQGAASIAAITPSTFQLGPSPALTCDGDSGGPMLVPQAGGTAVAGINALSNCTDLAVEQRTDAYAADFIEPFIAAAETHAICADDCEELTGGCSTGGGLGPLAALALLGLARRSPRVSRRASSAFEPLTRSS